MSDQHAIQLVETDALEQYPIAKGERLESHSFFPMHYHRWLNSDLYLLGDWDVQAVALALWALAQYQDPVGTLPDNPRLLSALLKGMPLQEWEAYCRREPGPLHGWRRCLVGNEIRLMHPVVTENAESALGLREQSADRRGADAERARLKRLRESVEKLGHRNLAEQDMFIGQLDLLLNERHPTGNRTVVRIVSAMEALGVRNL